MIEERNREALPEPGRIAFVRRRPCLIEDVSEPQVEGEATLVALSCLDDTQGEPLSVRGSTSSMRGC